MATRVRLDRRRLVLSLVVAAALVGFWFAITGAETEPERKLPTAIETVSPADGALVLRQTQVVVDLAPGYRGKLFIDGQEIPVVERLNEGSAGDEPTPIDAVFDPAQNTITFTPTVGATIPEFAPRPHQVTVSFWRFEESAEAAGNYSWTFRVQG